MGGLTREEVKMTHKQRGTFLIILFPNPAAVSRSSAATPPPTKWPCGPSRPHPSPNPATRRRERSAQLPKCGQNTSGL